MSRTHRKQWVAGGLAVVAAGLGVAAWAAPATTGPTTGPAASPATTAKPTAEPDRWDRRRGRDRRTPEVTSAAPAGAAAATSVDTTPKPMSRAYAVLEQRSIFVKGYQGIGPPPGPVNPPGPYIPATPPRPEASLVYRGYINDGGQSTALMEDTNAHSAFTVGVGGAVATGHVTDITFDALDYVSRGHTTHVTVGQSLDGVAAPAGADAAPTSAPSPGAPPGSSLGNTNGMSPDDLLTRMRKRREAELNKK